MTDRVKGLTVVLSDDFRDDDNHLLGIIEAIKCIKSVQSVVPIIAKGSDYMERSRIKRQLIIEIYEALEEILSDEEK